MIIKWNVSILCLTVKKQPPSSPKPSPARKRMSLEALQLELASPELSKGSSPYPGPSTSLQKKSLPGKRSTSPNSPKVMGPRMSLKRKSVTHKKPKRLASPEFNSPPKLKKQKKCETVTSAYRRSNHLSTSTSSSPSDSEGELPLAWQKIEEQRRNRMMKKGKQFKSPNMPQLEMVNSISTQSPKCDKKKSHNKTRKSESTSISLDSSPNIKEKTKHDKCHKSYKRYSVVGTSSETSVNNNKSQRLSLDSFPAQSQPQKRKYTKRKKVSPESDKSQPSLTKWFSRLDEKSPTADTQTSATKSEKEKPGPSPSRRKRPIVIEWRGKQLKIHSPRVVLMRNKAHTKLKPRNLEIDMTDHKGSPDWNRKIDVLSTIDTGSRVTRNMVELDFCDDFVDYDLLPLTETSPKSPAVAQRKSGVSTAKRDSEADSGTAAGASLLRRRKSVKNRENFEEKCLETSDNIAQGIVRTPTGTSENNFSFAEADCDGPSLRLTPRRQADRNAETDTLDSPSNLDRKKIKRKTSGANEIFVSDFLSKQSISSDRKTNGQGGVDACSPKKSIKKALGLGFEANSELDMSVQEAQLTPTRTSGNNFSFVTKANFYGQSLRLTPKRRADKQIKTDDIDSATYTTILSGRKERRITTVPNESLESELIQKSVPSYSDHTLKSNTPKKHVVEEAHADSPAKNLRLRKTEHGRDCIESIDGRTSETAEKKLSPLGSKGGILKKTTDTDTNSSIFNCKKTVHALTFQKNVLSFNKGEKENEKNDVRYQSVTKEAVNDSPSKHLRRLPSQKYQINSYDSTQHAMKPDLGTDEVFYSHNSDFNKTKSNASRTSGALKKYKTNSLKRDYDAFRHSKDTRQTYCDSNDVPSKKGSPNKKVLCHEKSNRLSSTILSTVDDNVTDLQSYTIPTPTSLSPESDSYTAGDSCSAAQSLSPSYFTKFRQRCSGTETDSSSLTATPGFTDSNCLTSFISPPSQLAALSNLQKNYMKTLTIPDLDSQQRTLRSSGMNAPEASDKNLMAEYYGTSSLEGSKVGGGKLSNRQTATATSIVG